MTKPIELFDVEKLLDHVTSEVGQRIIRRTPVKTGQTRDAWEVDLQANKITNPLPHVGVLEMGSSEQAPEGMVRVTLEEVPDIIDKFLKETNQ